MRPNRQPTGRAARRGVLLVVTALALLAPAAGAAGWQPLRLPSQSRVTSVHASPAIAGLAWTSDALSRDGGRTWTRAATPPPSVVVGGSGVWWSVPDRTLRRSLDGGRTWHDVPGLEAASRS